MNGPNTRSQLHKIFEDCPNVVSVFNLVETNQSIRLSLYGNGATIRVLTKHWATLEEAEVAFSKDPKLKPLQQFVALTIAELETAVYAFFSGFHAVLFDTMRSTMEIEFLLRDFLIWPSHLNEWLNLDKRARIRKFKPAKLRRRYIQWLSGESADLQESRDYSLHSEYLHVSPNQNPIGPAGLNSENHPAQLRILLAEITAHTGGLYPWCIDTGKEYL